MLVQLGARSDSLDVSDLLLDCHAKIRRFLGIAQRMSAGDASNLEDIRSAAAGVARYFTQAFPLHMADEDELVLPRLIGRFEPVDRALARMGKDHVEHAGLVDALAGLCSTLRDQPARLVELAPDLRDVVTRLEAPIGDHLAMEEAEIFPAVRLLAADEQRVIVAAMRERRTVR